MRDRAGRVLALPSQTPGLREQHGLSRTQTDYDAWAVELATGCKFAGAAALNRVFVELGGLWALIARLYAYPGLHQFEHSVYRWVAAHRGLLARLYGVAPECDQPGVFCD